MLIVLKFKVSMYVQKTNRVAIKIIYSPFKEQLNKTCFQSLCFKINIEKNKSARLPPAIQTNPIITTFTGVYSEDFKKQSMADKKTVTTSQTQAKNQQKHQKFQISKQYPYIFQENQQ
eukprot:TRINITY_DN2755_c0_g1_i3.p1 TRINITY_DN2755_c0_g1~~TRINITY_DN2755_c0_g1_i3.p1  ORF type:complete len:118 (-),score=7.49 TRINITY_DN2755_c0_g1_i3:82-435(-)